MDLRSNCRPLKSEINNNYNITYESTNFHIKISSELEKKLEFPQVKNCSKFHRNSQFIQWLIRNLWGVNHDGTEQCWHIQGSTDPQVGEQYLVDMVRSEVSILDDPFPVYDFHFCRSWWGIVRLVLVRGWSMKNLWTLPW